MTGPASQVLAAGPPAMLHTVAAHAHYPTSPQHRSLRAGCQQHSQLHVGIAALFKLRHVVLWVLLCCMAEGILTQAR